MMRATSPTSCRALAPQMRPQEVEDLMVDISMVHSDINKYIYIYIYIYIYCKYIVRERYIYI